MWCKRLSAALFTFALAVSPAYAGSSTISVFDSSLAAHIYDVITDAAGHFIAEYGLCDGVAAAQCVSVKAASTAPTASDPAVVVAVSPNLAPSSACTSTALETSHVCKASAGVLLGYYCNVTGGAAGFCIVLNATTVPATGALTGAQVLDTCAFAAGAMGCSLDRIPIPRAYGTGIVILVSSAASPFTYTTGVLTAYISADYN